MHAYTKEELLILLEARELSRINALSENDFQNEAAEWFGVLADEEWKPYTIDEYMENFMLWQADKSVEELQELLNQ